VIIITYICSDNFINITSIDQLSDELTYKYLNSEYLIIALHLPYEFSIFYCFTISLICHQETNYIENMLLT